MTARNPLVLIGGTAQELPAGDTVNGGGAGTDYSGIAILDFGTGAAFATVDVPCLGVTDESVVLLQMSHLGTTDNSAEEHMVVPVKLDVSVVSPGVAFRILMTTTRKGLLSRTWAVKWKVV